jgi:hypothetical protein
VDKNVIDPPQQSSEAPESIEAGEFWTYQLLALSTLVHKSHGDCDMRPTKILTASNKYATTKYSFENGLRQIIQWCDGKLARH